MPMSQTCSRRSKSVLLRLQAYGKIHQLIYVQVGNIWKMRSAKHIMSERFVSLMDDEPISKAIAVFDEQKPAAIVVFSRNRRYTGVLSERWIYRARTDPKRTKVGALTRYVPAAHEDTSLVDIARWMFENHVQIVPVFSGAARNRKKDETSENLVGIVSDISLLSAAVEDSDFGDEKVSEYATSNLIYLNPDDSVAKALAMFRENAISRAPVIERGKVVGMLTMHDIVTRFLMPRERATSGELSGEKVRTLSTPVKYVMSYPVISVPPDGRIRDVVSLMIKRDISGVLIMEHNRCRGIITKRDLLEAFVNVSKTERAKVIVQFAGDYEGIDDFQMSHIRRDINSLAEKFAKMFDEGMLVVHLKRIKANEADASDEHFNIRIRFFAPGTVLSAHEEGFGAIDVMERLKDKIERKILEEKERTRETLRKSRHRAGGEDFL